MGEVWLRRQTKVRKNRTRLPLLPCLPYSKKERSFEQGDHPGHKHLHTSPLLANKFLWKEFTERHGEREPLSSPVLAGEGVSGSPPG